MNDRPADREHATDPTPSEDTTMDATTTPAPDTDRTTEFPLDDAATGTATPTSTITHTGTTTDGETRPAYGVPPLGSDTRFATRGLGTGAVGTTSFDSTGFGAAVTGSSLAHQGSTALAPVERDSRFSPVLATAGIGSLAVAGWALAGAPAITTTVTTAAGITLAVLVGLALLLGAIFGGRNRGTTA